MAKNLSKMDTSVGTRTRAENTAQVHTPGLSNTSREDDDVQFMFSAPLRKNRKRKRYVTNLSKAIVPANPLIRLSGLQPTKGGSPPILLAKPSVSVKVEQRRASAGMVQQLESCHIGFGENTRFPVRSGSLPAISATAGRPSTSQPIQSNSVPQSKHWRPLHDSVISDPTFSVPWDVSSILSQPYVAPSSWKPVCFDSNSAKRQKRDERGSNLHSVGHSQVSPKTIHPLAPSPLRDSTGGYDGFVDMLGSSGMQDMLGLTIPSDPMEVTWPEATCESPTNFDPRGNQLHFGSATTPGNTVGTESVNVSPHMAPPSVLNNTSTNIASHQNPRGFQQYQVANTHPAVFDYSSTNDQSIHSPANSNLEGQGHGQASREKHPTVQTPATPGTNSHSIPRVATNSSSTPSPCFFWRNPRPPQLTPTRDLNKNSPDTLQTQESDMLRKPSLYSIPPWPMPNLTVTSKRPAETNGRGTFSQNPTSGHGGTMERQTPASQRSTVSHGISNQTNQLNAEANRPRHNAVSVTTTKQASNTSTAENGRSQGSRKRRRLSHSPNL